MKIIKVGLASCGISAGADKVYDKLSEFISNNNIKDIKLEKVGCIGKCYLEPLVDLEISGKKFTFTQVDDKKTDEIINKYILGNETPSLKPLNFKKQIRIVLRNTGIINPENIEEYLERDGYKALEKVLNTMSPENVIEEIKKSGLRGRGGAGFPTGLKWSFAAKVKSDEKYFVCNADEGDPGAFMDRSVLEGDPHSVIEGMIIGAYAIGATHGYIYVRAEYPLAIKRLNIALKQARERNFLGKNILGTNFSFDIKLKQGAGAFVCGEETALIHSIEGKRGMPRKRPPFPAQSGIWEKPTNINNVETLANIAWIILNGADKFASIGTETSKGTKVFALAGKIKNTGLIEVPMGTTLREIIFEIGGGIVDNKKFKAVQLGGPSGGCLPESLIDTKVDYEELTKTGAIMGSGGMIVMDESTCIVDVARYFLNFTQNESCGKCTFCRIGTKRMLETLERITKGNGKLEDIDMLISLADKIKKSSLCGLGQTAPNPVLTTIKYFKEEYVEHINEKKCKALVCKELLEYRIDPEKCTGCTLCARVCPTNAITGEVKKTHYIDPQTCIKCGQCYNACKFDAINILTGTIK